MKRSGASAERRILPAALSAIALATAEALMEEGHRLSADSRHAVRLLAVFQIS
jgi:hypothetical protein